MSKQRDALEAALAGMEKPFRDAFLKSVSDITSSAKLALVTAHLERGDVNAAIAALNLRSEFLAPLEEAMRASYLAGGAAALAALPRVGADIRFGGRNLRSEEYLVKRSSERIVEILEDQRAGIRQALLSGMIEGDNPRTTARQLLGTLNRATGKREGGLIGLTQRQMDRVKDVREMLKTESGMRTYLNYKLRNKTYDRMVKKALREGKPLAADATRKISEKYADKLLRYRAEMIARTESLTALNTAQADAMDQLIADDRYQVSSITKAWRSAKDVRVRESHARLDGEEVPYDQPFSNGMMHPGEPGAPPEEVIHCRCVTEMKVDFLGTLRRTS